MKMKKRTDKYEKAMTDSEKVIFKINCTRFKTNKPPFNTNDHSDKR